MVYLNSVLSFVVVALLLFVRRPDFVVSRQVGSCYVESWIPTILDNNAITYHTYSREVEQIIIIILYYNGSMYYAYVDSIYDMIRTECSADNAVTNC